jgi:hypothetical protein
MGTYYRNITKFIDTIMKIKKDALIPEGCSEGRIFKEGYKHVRN